MMHSRIKQLKMIWLQGADIEGWYLRMGLIPEKGDGTREGGQYTNL
jgi:hypothetical protein